MRRNDDVTTSHNLSASAEYRVHQVSLPLRVQAIFRLIHEEYRLLVQAKTNGENG
ncbi:hypothetical protein D3C71_2210230 [compost metagenome]